MNVQFSSVDIFLNENYMQYINDTIYTSHAVIKNECSQILLYVWLPPKVRIKDLN